MTSDNDVLDELNELKRSGARNAMRIGLGVALIILVAGAIPWALGAGFLGTAMLGAPQLHMDVRNNGGAPVTVRVQRTAGLFPMAQSLLVPPQRQLTLTARAGDIRMTLTRGEETIYESEFEFDSHLFVSTDEDECFAIFDISGLYGDSTTWGYPVVRRVEAGEFVVSLDTPHLILPGGLPPDTIFGVTWWIEEISCRTIAEQDDEVLASIAETRWTQREIELQRAREARARQ